MELNIFTGLLVIIVILGMSSARPQFNAAELNIPFHLTVGNTENQTRVYRIAFRPEDGLKNRVRFQEKHGKFGERLIASFGQGISPAQVLKPDDQIVNRNNWTLRDKQKHQYYFTAVSYETTTTASASSSANIHAATSLKTTSL